MAGIFAEKIHWLSTSGQETWLIPSRHALFSAIPLVLTSLGNYLGAVVV